MTSKIARIITVLLIIAFYNISIMNDNQGTDRMPSCGFASIIKHAADKYGVPAGLIAAIIKAESNFNPQAVSHRGAIGLMQLNPTTIEHLNVKNPFNPRENILAGAKYIGFLLKLYKGNTKMALAAYNAGPGNVAKYGSVPPFPQTRQYIPKVMRYYSEYKNLDA
jgi:soluble lytic murein transglycosylase-like protein